jgi:hypothetical protein
MKTYILETESGLFLSNNNEWNHTKKVSDIKEATKFNYNDAVSFSNLHYQISDVKTKLLEVNSDRFCELVAISFSGLSQQVYKNDCEIDYNSRY